jgi:hypothetical protein
MGYHDREEDGVKPRKWAIKPSHGSPAQGKEKVAYIVDLSSVAIWRRSQQIKVQERVLKGRRVKR